MRHVIRFAVAFALMTSTAAVADAQNTLQMAAGCAPRAVTAPPPVDALRLIGAQDTVGRELFGAGDLVVIGGGRGRSVELGQQFFSCDDRPPGAAVAAPARSARPAGYASSPWTTRRLLRSSTLPATAC
jgi:hypothetical protein